MIAFAIRRSKASKPRTRRCIEHPYQAIGIALGVGAIIGYLVTRRCSRHGD